jgi:nitroreductase
MNMTELTDLIKTRRSIRQFQEKPVPEELILQAVELATNAPNSGNQQNWRFYVVLNHQRIADMADAVDAIGNEVYSWPEAQQFAAKAPKKPTPFRSAPAVIVVASSKYQSPLDFILEAHGMSDPRGNQIREWRNAVQSKIQSVGSGAAYLCLILHQMGVGSLWMTGPMQARGDIEKILKMPPGMDAFALIAVGYPAAIPAPPGRKPLTEVCEIIR